MVKIDKLSKNCVLGGSRITPPLAMRLARAFAAAHLLRKGKMRLESSGSEPLWSTERGKKVAENDVFLIFFGNQCLREGGDQGLHQRLLEAVCKCIEYLLKLTIIPIQVYFFYERKDKYLCL